MNLKCLKIAIVTLLLFLISNVASAENALQDTENQELIENATDSVMVEQSVPLSTSTEILLDLKSEGFSFNSLMRGVLGILVLLFLGWIFSSDRKAIQWKNILIALILQLLLAFCVLNVGPVRWIFEFFGKIFMVILDFTKEGTNYLFEGFLDTSKFGYMFAFQVLPTIIFFSALTSLLFYFGIIQVVVKGLAFVFSRLMGLSGAEALSVAGNIFLGQTESPLLIKAYLHKMNDSEMLLVMTGGMATIAGGVLAAYIAMLGGDDPQMRLEFARHLLTASVMGAPGAIIFSKILLPPSGEIDKSLDVSKNQFGKNALDAITTGTTEGVKLAANVAGMLLVFVALIAMANYILAKIGIIGGLNDAIAAFTNGSFDSLSLQVILGYIFAPLMWLIGVPFDDIALVGQLLGEKLIMTEFIGYVSLTEMKAAGVFHNPKSIIMATYILCGFANFASIGIQIGGIGSLVPEKRSLLSKYGTRALWAGTLASLLSATIIGMIMG